MDSERVIKVSKSRLKQADWVHHGYDARLESMFKQGKKRLSAKNFELLLDYDTAMVGDVLSKATRTKHLQTIITMSGILDKDWTDCTKDDINGLVYKIMQTYADGKGQETHSTYDMKKVIKLFFRWVKTGDRRKKLNEPEVLEIRGVRQGKVKDSIVREDLITEDDLKKLLLACQGNVRDRALIHVHYEAGTRAGELLSLRIRDVKFDEYGAIISVTGKTGDRPIRLVESVPNLSVYLNTHPYKDKGDSPLWIGMGKENYGKPLAIHAVRMMFNRMGAKAKLGKRIYLQLFRHSEATRTANYMTEAQLRKRHGWANVSKMPSRYVHLVDQDVDDQVLAQYGMKKPKQVKQITNKCKFCDSFNQTEADVCIKCAKPLHLEQAIKIDEEKQAKLDKVEARLAKLEDFERIRLEGAKLFQEETKGMSKKEKQKVFQAGIDQAVKELIGDKIDFLTSFLEKQGKK